VGIVRQSYSTIGGPTYGSMITTSWSRIWVHIDAPTMRAIEWAGTLIDALNDEAAAPSVAPSSLQQNTQLVPGQRRRGRAARHRGQRQALPSAGASGHRGVHSTTSRPSRSGGSGCGILGRRLPARPPSATDSSPSSRFVCTRWPRKRWPRSVGRTMGWRSARAF
jgi:hypothetical protein